MNGTAVDTPYLVLPDSHYSAVGATELTSGRAVQRGGFCTYIEISSPGSSHDRRALFALAEIGLEGALSSSWQQFRKTREAKPNWDGYGAASPNAIALANAQALLETLTADGLFPEFIQPSPEGGVTISFLRGSRHAAIEMHNDGDAVAVISRVDGAPEVWEFPAGTDEQADAIARISRFVLG